jgi:hypothetical protein
MVYPSAAPFTNVNSFSQRAECGIIRKGARSMEKRYSLHGFIIVEADTYLVWIQHVGDFNDTGEMMYLAGRAYIHPTYDVILLGGSKALKADKTLRTFEEVERYLASLPRWNKTRYYVKLADLQLYSLLDCETGEVVYSERNPEIMRSLITGEES